jgi:hypothetical protein
MPQPTCKGFRLERIRTWQSELSIQGCTKAFGPGPIRVARDTEMKRTHTGGKNDKFLLPHYYNHSPK